ncbi:MAG: hypothetical protein V7739_19840 [Motiliproteus sp.]
MKSTFLLFATTLIVSGCSISPILGSDGVYKANYTSAWGAGASEDFVTEEVREKAIKFCADKSKKTEILYVQGRGGVLGIELAEAWIEFRCTEGAGQ